jgi:DNA-binding NarL/FixJ family response regulator
MIDPTMARTIKVVLIDDHDLVRAGLEQLLGATPDITVVATGSDGSFAVDLVDAHSPDVVLMDLSMPGVDGIEATRRVHAVSPDTRIVILTSFSERGRILEAIDAGALGYLLKDADADEIVRGVRAAHEGGSPLDPRVAVTLVQQRRATDNAADSLTPREREVLDCVAEGLPNKLIARRLGIAERTVKAHLTRVFSVLGVTDRTQAALWAREHGLSAVPA